MSRPGRPMRERPVAAPPARVLVLAYGNPGRGDDALGPELARRLAPPDGDPAGHDVEILAEIQLQPEHALDLAGRDLALFVDASLDCAAPFDFGRVAPRRDRTFTTHAMSPAAVLETWREVFSEPAPPAFLLAIRGERFELGEPLGEAARAHLEAAQRFAAGLLARPESGYWDERARAIAHRPPDDAAGREASRS